MITRFVCASSLLGSITMALVFALPGSGTVIFSDNFNSGASPLWGNQSGNWAASGGVYFAQSPNNSPLTHSLLPFAVSDFVLDVDVNGASDGGIWLRANADRSNGVLLVVGGMAHAGTGLYWHIGPDYNTTVNPSAGLFSQGDNIHVQVVVSGNTYSVYLNGSPNPASTLVTSSVPNGLVGLYDFTGHTFGQQGFDNFTLSTEVAPIPEPSPALLAVAGLACLFAAVRIKSCF